MDKRTLTILDITGIQDYIFGSNRLRENIGASFLVEQVTSQWLCDALSAYTHNLSADGQQVYDPPNSPKGADRLQAEVVYRGGGNVVILFDTLEHAQTSVTNLSKRIIEEAPGLELAAAHITFDWDTCAVGGMQGKYNQLLEKLAQSKQTRRPSTPLLGQSVTLECRSTGLPAVAFVNLSSEDDTQKGPDILPVSAEIATKVKDRIREEADKRLQAMWPPDITKRYRLTRQLDQLGRSHGESSYIALVHADGNNMGIRFQEIIEEDDTKEQNDHCIAAIRELSRSVEAAGRAALTATVTTLVATLDALPTDDPLKQSLEIRDSRKNASAHYYLPFRPLVFGGDDVTFVCDGRLGLSLAATYLTAFEQAATNLPGGPAYACAGVAIVKTHYPFARAYDICEDLCKNAKRMAKEVKKTHSKDASAEVKEKHGEDVSAMDWHFAISGPIGSLTDIRDRSDVPEHDDLLTDTHNRSDAPKHDRSERTQTLWMRPITLTKTSLSSWRHWDAFCQIIAGFDKDWQERRNKLFQLQEALRKGPDETKYFRDAFSLPCLPKPEDIDEDQSKTGWGQDDDGMLHCAYFDAIEALDFHIPIRSREE